MGERASRARVTTPRRTTSHHAFRRAKGAKRGAKVRAVSTRTQTLQDRSSVPDGSMLASTDAPLPRPHKLRLRSLPPKHEYGGGVRHLLRVARVRPSLTFALALFSGYSSELREPRVQLVLLGKFGMKQLARLNFWTAYELIQRRHPRLTLIDVLGAYHAATRKQAAAIEARRRQ